MSRKARPDMTEKLFDWDVMNNNNKNRPRIIPKFRILRLHVCGKNN